jgi:hypothetical protein
MFAELERERYLYQEVAAAEIVDRFGQDFVYDNNLGNLGIGRDVLSEFRKLTEKTVVWERSERAWRFRDEADPSSRQVD